MAYYSKWVKAWKRDTSREAIQKYSVIRLIKNNA